MGSYFFLTKEKISSSEEGAGEIASAEAGENEEVVDSGSYAIGFTDPDEE